MGEVSDGHRQFWCPLVLTFSYSSTRCRACYTDAGSASMATAPMPARIHGFPARHHRLGISLATGSVSPRMAWWMGCSARRTATSAKSRRDDAQDMLGHSRRSGTEHNKAHCKRVAPKGKSGGGVSAGKFLHLRSGAGRATQAKTSRAHKS